MSKANATSRFFAIAMPRAARAEGRIATSVGATCDAIRYGAPDGVRRAGFDTKGFDASEGVSIEAGLVVAPGATCGVETTPSRAITASLPLIRWTVACTIAPTVAWLM